MKIAITGHTNGIGQAFARYLESRNHEIIGLSKREGNNIRNIPKIAEKIIGCDMFINNAQAGFAQTELFLNTARSWWNDRSKMIWNISTVMAVDYKMPSFGNLTDVQLAEYRSQKRALEDATRTVKSQGAKVRICTLRPGSVATQPYNNPGEDSADVDLWVKTVCELYISCRERDLFPDELCLNFKKEAPTL